MIIFNIGKPFDGGDHGKAYPLDVKFEDNRDTEHEGYAEYGKIHVWVGGKNDKAVVYGYVSGTKDQVIVLTNEEKSFFYDAVTKGGI